MTDLPVSLNHYALEKAAKKLLDLKFPEPQTFAEARAVAKCTIYAYLDALPPINTSFLDPDMPAQELRLHMGEMTAQEERTARAAIRWANTQRTKALVQNSDVSCPFCLESGFDHASLKGHLLHRDCAPFAETEEHPRRFG